MSRPAHRMAGPLLCFGLEEQIRRLRDEPAPTSGNRNAITLIKDGPLRVVLVLLAGGSLLDEHTVPGPATILVGSGRVRFQARGEERELDAGALVAVESGVPHAALALEESALLLTVVDPRAMADD